MFSLNSIWAPDSINYLTEMVMQSFAGKFFLTLVQQWPVGTNFTIPHYESVAKNSDEWWNEIEARDGIFKFISYETNQSPMLLRERERRLLF